MGLAGRNRHPPRVALGHIGVIARGIVTVVPGARLGIIVITVVAIVPPLVLRSGSVFTLITWNSPALQQCVKERYTSLMQRKIFWFIFTALGLAADFTLPFWWAVAATFPLLLLSWWIAYRSDWFPS